MSPVETDLRTCAVSHLSCAILSALSEEGPFSSSISQLFQNSEVSLALGPPLLSAFYTFLSTQNLEAQVVMEGLSPADILYKRMLILSQALLVPWCIPQLAAQ